MPYFIMLNHNKPSALLAEITAYFYYEYRLNKEIKAGFDEAIDNTKESDIPIKSTELAYKDINYANINPAIKTDDLAQIVVKYQGFYR